MSAAGPLRGPVKRKEAAAPPLIFRRAAQAMGPLLRPPGCCASRCARQPCGLPWTPETSAAPEGRKRDQAQGLPPARRAARGPLAVAGVCENRTPGNKVNWRSIVRRRGEITQIQVRAPGPVTSSQQSHLASCVTQNQVCMKLGMLQLARAHLVEEQTPSRFTFHDLLRAYASKSVQEHESDAERRAADHRVLDHYLHTAQAAAQFLHPRMDFVITTPRQPGIVPQKFLDYGTAWAWFETEYPVLMAAIRLAASAGWDDYTWQLPSALEVYFDRRGHRHDCLAAQHTALAAAQRREDRHGQAYAHYGLGRAFHWFGRFEEARTHLEQALNFFQELNEPVNTVHTHIDLSHILEHQNRFTDALRHAQRALSPPRATDNRRAQARALYFVGWRHAGRS